MNKTLFIIALAFCFFMTGDEEKEKSQENSNQCRRLEYCEEPDNKIKIPVYLRAMNKFTGRVYGPLFISYFEIN